MKKTILLLCCLWLAAGSTVAREYCVEKIPCVCQARHLPCFNAIDARGDFDLEINGSAYQQSFAVWDTAERLQKVKTTVENHTLHLVAPNPSSVGRTKICIHLPYLKQLHYTDGAANIAIHRLKPYQPLGMTLEGYAKVYVNGNVNLRQLVVGNNAQLSLYWLNTHDLSLKATDNARICLAGIVGTLETEASQASWINARYLRAAQVFAKSYNRARIDLHPTCALNALACDQSGIYFYRNPRFQAPYVQCTGSVVTMTDTCYPPCSLCDNACCKNGWH